MGVQEELAPVPPWVRRVAGATDPGVVCKSAVAELHRVLDKHLVCVSVADGSEELSVRAAEGERSAAVTGLSFPIGSGVGGLAMSLRKPVSVREYAAMHLTRELVEVMVQREGVRGAASYPLYHGEHPLGVLFAGRRDEGVLSDRELDVLREAAGLLGPLIGSSLQVERRIELAVAAERQRIAIDLHDRVIPPLFAIGAMASSAREGGAHARVLRDEDLGDIQALASTANASLRETLRALGPVPAEQDLLLRIHAVVGGYARHHARPIEVVVVGQPTSIPLDVCDVLVAVVREACVNILKHSGHSSALVTVAYLAGSTEVVIQDDGPGLPAGFEIASVASASVGEHFGLASLHRRVRSVDGVLEVGNHEDGGVRVRALVPSDEA